MWDWERMLAHEDSEPGWLRNVFQGQYEECYLMQYTGLKDKNGREIYKGDILKTDRGNYFVKEVLPFIELVGYDEWSDPGDEPEEYHNGDYYQGSNIQSHSWNEFVVIGNVYENPELLKGVS
jgi:uncharacterized phage protein (TIGR01671 family)